jgi:hypothetical protein
MIFANSTYYPEGGANDLIVTTNDLDEAYLIAREYLHDSDYLWAHIYDCQEHIIISVDHVKK